MKSFVALGSNLGDRQANVEAGLTELRRLGHLVPSSVVMETRDVSGMGPDYINTVALLETEEDDACRLLEMLLRIELLLGRDRNLGRNAPRTLDLDLIEVEGTTGSWKWPTPPDLRILGPELTLELPHPRSAERPFVQAPLRDLKTR